MRGLPIPSDPLPQPPYEAVLLRPPHNLWMGIHGGYEVPPAIIWLAEAANARIGLPPPDWRDHLEGAPGARVIEEWGVWRDAQEAAA